MPFPKSLSVAYPGNVEGNIHVSIFIEDGSVSVLMVVAAEVKTIDRIIPVGNAIAIGVCNFGQFTSLRAVEGPIAMRQAQNFMHAGCESFIMRLPGIAVRVLDHP